MAMEASAATTYVNAAHFKASFACVFSVFVVMLVLSSHFNALADASNSTGKVTTVNSVDTANKMIPTNKIVGLPPPKPSIPKPIIIIHCDKVLLTFTAGTSLLRSVSME